MRGLGDAVLCARAFVQDEPFAVLLGDDVVYNGEGRPALKQLIDVYNATGSSVLGCQTVPEDKVSSYGIIKGEPTDDVRTMRVLDMVGGEACRRECAEPHGGTGPLHHHTGDL